mmetsp:Transcript_12624/g.24738  ORF Transcript_12624/g.24738 Transcript_12624/m.24738 type:complete len:170 (-) Transcript_12624:752-1261(-)
MAVDTIPRRADSKHVSACRPPRLSDVTPENAAPAEAPISAQNRSVADCMSEVASCVPRKYMLPHSLVHFEAPKLRLLHKKIASIAGQHRTDEVLTSMFVWEWAAVFSSALALVLTFADLSTKAIALRRAVAPPRCSITCTSNATRAELKPKPRRVARQDIPRRLAITVP